MTDSAADDLLVTAEQFLQYLRVERRLSPVTITNTAASSPRWRK